MDKEAIPGMDKLLTTSSTLINPTTLVFIHKGGSHYAVEKIIAAAT